MNQSKPLPPQSLVEEYLQRRAALEKLETAFKACAPGKEKDDLLEQLERVRYDFSQWFNDSSDCWKCDFSQWEVRKSKHDYTQDELNNMWAGHREREKAIVTAEAEATPAGLERKHAPALSAIEQAMLDLYLKLEPFTEEVGLNALAANKLAFSSRRLMRMLKRMNVT